SLEIRQKALPNGHPDIAHSLYNLATLLTRQGKFEQAEPYWRELAQWCVAHPQGIPAYHITAADVFSRLIACYRALDQAENAAQGEPKLREALEAEIANISSKLKKTGIIH